MEKTTTYSDFVLYSYWRASCAYRVRLALNIKEIPYKMVSINLLKNENLGEEYLKINHYGRIPVLEFQVKIGDAEPVTKKMTESIAIIEFLEEVFPDKKSLYPANKLEKARVRGLAMHVACNIHALQNLNVLSHVEKLGHDKIEWAKNFVLAELSDLEKDLTETSGKFSFGDEVTYADIFIVPQLYFFTRFGLSMDDYPHLSKVLKNTLELKPFFDAYPENQPDYVK